MPVSDQVLHGIEILRLKSISALDEIRFDSTALTALTGANGSGKSTVLHALACAFRPPENSEATNFRFPNFFLPTSDSRWQGSSFKVRHSFRNGPQLVQDAVQHYGKYDDRWTPRYSSRPERHIEYVGVSTCVPKIEEERATSYLELQTQERPDEIARLVREAASRVLNREFTGSTTKNHWSGRRYRGVVCGGLAYSSLSMGAGEQRIFEILERVFHAPRSSLILIDELDLLLHEDALGKLIKVLAERSMLRSLQIVFTTHRESVLSKQDVITVHHIFGSTSKTLSLPGTHPDVWHRLTGAPQRPLEIFVEDDLAGAVVSKVADCLGVRRFVQISTTGAATNVFTVACGLALRNGLNPNQLFVTDGDVIATQAARVAQVNRILTGNDALAQRRRQDVLAQVAMFAMPEGMWPEKRLHHFLVTIEEDGDGELCQIAREIGMPMERHGFLDDIIARMGHSREVGLSKLVDAAARSPGWNEYVAPVHEWLSARKLAAGL